jgi:hypothetical protein
VANLSIRNLKTTNNFMIQRDKARAVRQHQHWTAPTSWLNWPVFFRVDLESGSVGRDE